jgi:hypothetical protein
MSWQINLRTCYSLFYVRQVAHVFKLTFASYKAGFPLELLTWTVTLLGGHSTTSNASAWSGSGSIASPGSRHTVTLTTTKKPTMQVARRSNEHCVSRGNPQQELVYMLAWSFSLCCSTTWISFSMAHFCVSLEAPVLYFLHRLKNALLLNVILLSTIVESKVCCASG